jgi:hypothetical protein
VRHKTPFGGTLKARQPAGPSFAQNQQLVTAPALTVVKHVVSTGRGIVQLATFAGVHRIAGNTISPVPGRRRGSLIGAPSIILATELAADLAIILAQILTGILTVILHINLGWRRLGRGKANHSRRNCQNLECSHGADFRTGRLSGSEPNGDSCSTFPTLTGFSVRTAFKQTRKRQSDVRPSLPGTGFPCNKLAGATIGETVQSVWPLLCRRRGAQAPWSGPRLPFGRWLRNPHQGRPAWPSPTSRRLLPEPANHVHPE